MKTYWFRFTNGSTTFVRDVERHTIANGVLYLWSPRGQLGGGGEQLGAFVLANVRSWTTEDGQ
jgi:hypothetical protein